MGVGFTHLVILSFTNLSTYGVSLYLGVATNDVTHKRITILIQSSYQYGRVMMKEAIIQVYVKSLH